MQAYIDHLMTLNEDSNVRALFKTALQKLTGNAFTTHIGWACPHVYHLGASHNTANLIVIHNKTATLDLSHVLPEVMHIATTCNLYLATFVSCTSYTMCVEHTLMLIFCVVLFSGGCGGCVEALRGIRGRPQHPVRGDHQTRHPSR